MIPRHDLAQDIRTRLRHNPVVTLIGPRQCGKTTLAHSIASGRRVTGFDLEDPASRRRLEHPMTALAPLRGLVLIDEAQLQPELFPILRVLADRRPLPARFLLLGSASPDLMRDSSESLAGRVSFVDMGGFDLDEVGLGSLRPLWLRGGLPRSFLARSDPLSFAWREDFIATFLERDLRRFGVEIPPLALRRLWSMIAHYHGQTWNASEIGRSLAESHTTVKRHLDVLSGALVVRQLQPWFANISKRQVKAPKVYIRDSGLLHALLGVARFDALESAPWLGASWEGFVVEHVARLVGERNLFFWSTQSGAELDMLAMVRGRRYGIEVKYADAPTTTKSMRIAMTDLALDHLWVVYPGRERYLLDEHIEVLGLAQLRVELRRVTAGRRPTSHR